MAKGESYDDLIFQLGDLARERLANRPTRPRSMDRVLKAEEVHEARRAELEDLEHQLNDEDAAYQDFLAQQDAERNEHKEIVKKWRRAVEAIEGRTKALRKQLTSQKASLRYETEAVRKTEEKHRDLEMTQHHQHAKIASSLENLKKLRLVLMRKQRDIEELEAEFDQVLTPRPGQPGAQGILAHRRLLEMEDEAEQRRLEHEETMTRLDQEAGGKEEEARAAEEFLDQAIFLLGEECYALRVPDPALSVFYPRLDQAK